MEAPHKCQKEGCPIAPYKGQEYCSNHSQATKALRKRINTIWRHTEEGKAKVRAYNRQAYIKRHMGNEQPANEQE